MQKRPKITEYRFDQWADDLRGWIRKSVSPFENDTPEKQAERKDRGSWDLLFFFKTYLPHYYSVDFDDFHEEWADLSEIRNQIGLLAAPREHAKSTFFSFGVPIHDAAYVLKHFIMLISDTNDQAKGFTIPIRLELEENPRLLHDFGEFRGRKWSDSDFTTTGGVRVLARGRGEKVRGLKNMQYRPDRAIVDDLENDQNVRNPKLVKQGMDWLLTAVLGSMGDGFSFTMVGNLFAARSILAQMMKEKDAEGQPLYVSKVYDAVREDGSPLWPALWPLERLQQRQRQMGTVRFNREMRNRVGAEDSPIRESWILYVPHAELAPDIWSKKQFIVSAFLDPSGKGTETSDFKAIVVAGKCIETGIIECLHAWIRHATVNEMWAQVWQIDEEYGGCGMGVEINMFQDFLIDSYKNYAERTGRWVNMRKVIHSSEKIARIVNRLSPLCEFGKVRFIRGNSDQDLLVEQLIYIMDQNVNDDGPDALEGAISGLVSGAAVSLGRDPEKKASVSGRDHKRVAGRGGFFGRFRKAA